jgi:hypothetical protein
MRVWIYNRVKALPTVAEKIGERIISSGSGDNPEPPFIVINMGVEQAVPGMPPSSKTSQVPFNVQVHDAPGSMLDIDEVALAVKNGVPTLDSLKIGGLSVMEIKWTDTGQDGFDDHWGTNFRPVRFIATTAH